MRIFEIMKARVNLTIEQDLLAKIKEYANKEGKSISELVERFFEQMIKKKKENEPDLFELMKNLPPIELPENFDYKEEYYKAKMKKYGF